MTGTQTLIARGALGIVAAGAGAVAVLTKRFYQGTAPAFDRRATSIFLASRLGIYFLVYFVLHIAPRGDIPAYYFPEASAVLRGQLPYRDFPSSYAPLHAYMDALFILFWKSPLAIIALAILAELLLLWVWLRLARSFCSERHLRMAAMLYLASPISLQYVTIDGQDNVIIAALLAIAMLLVLKRREAASGLTVASGIIVIKFLPLLYIPAFFFTARRHLRWLIPCASALVIGYGAFARLHLPILSPLIAEGQLKSAGNLPYLIESLFNRPIPPLITDSVLLIALTLISALIALSARAAEQEVRVRILACGTTALTLTLVLLAKKSWPAYLVLALFPLCLLATEKALSRRRLAALSLFGVVAVVEHSFWASILDQATAPEFHQQMIARQPAALLSLALQCLLLAGYVWLLLEAIHQIVAARPYPAPPIPHQPDAVRLDRAAL